MEQIEGRKSRLDNKVDIIEKSTEDKKKKKYVWNIQELRHH
jgi:hypothetical protein